MWATKPTCQFTASLATRHPSHEGPLRQVPSDVVASSVPKKAVGEVTCLRAEPAQLGTVVQLHPSFCLVVISTFRITHGPRGRISISGATVLLRHIEAISPHSLQGKRSNHVQPTLFVDTEGPSPLSRRARKTVSTVSR